MDHSVQLLHCSEEQFDKCIQSMDVRSLVDTISVLQREMAREQQHFNTLSVQLSLIPDNQSAEYDEVSGEMMECQGRLAMLMGRNMKCFTQEVANENAELLAGLAQESGEMFGMPELDTVPQRSPQEGPKETPRQGTGIPEKGHLTNIYDHSGHQPHTEKKEHAFKENGFSENLKELSIYSVDIDTSDENDIRHQERLEHAPSNTKKGYEFEYTVDSGIIMHDRSENSRLPSEKQVKTDIDLKGAFPNGIHTSDEEKSALKDETSEKSPQIKVVSETTLFINSSTDDAKDSNNYEEFIFNTQIKQLADPTEVADYNQSDLLSHQSTDEGAQLEEAFQEAEVEESPRPNHEAIIDVAPWSESMLQAGANDVEELSQTVKLSDSDTRGHVERDSGYTDRDFTDDSSPSEELQEKAVKQRTELSIQPAKVLSYPEPELRQTDVAVRQSEKVKSTPEPGMKRTSVTMMLAARPVSQPVVKQSIPEPNAHDEGEQKEGPHILRVGSAGSGKADSPDSGTETSTSALNIHLQQTEARNDSVSEAGNAGTNTKPVNSGVTVVGGQLAEDDTVIVEEHYEKIKDRVTLKNWDPTLLLRRLYEIKQAPDVDEGVGNRYINMEGFMEKLPMNKKKATLLKTWRRRFFKTRDGCLYYYEPEGPEDDLDPEDNNHTDKLNGFMQLSGGTIDEVGGRMLGIDDGRGRYLVVRCPTAQEFDNWKAALESQTVDNTKLKFVKPVLSPSPHVSKRVVIIDLGSASIRAGVVGSEPSLPQLFFPCVMATNKSTGQVVYGSEALKPSVRSTSTVSYPVRPSTKIDKFSIDVEVMSGLFNKIFKDLKVNPRQNWVLISAPANFNEKTKGFFVEMLITQFYVMGVNIVNQTLLSLYSYNASSGIVVDLGERLEIIPVTDGYIIESGVARQPYGGHRVAEALNSSLTENKYRFFTDVEFLIVRHVMEQSCFVSQDYHAELRQYVKQPSNYTRSVDLLPFDLPEGSWSNVTHDVGRFRCCEGLFCSDLWGMDNPSVQTLVYKAVQGCSMDARREMCRSIYLTGGVSLLPGFAERLQLELTKLMPTSIVVQVHASPHRYHAAYIGGCVLANMNVFEQACITADEWHQQGIGSLKKWQNF